MSRCGTLKDYLSLVAAFKDENKRHNKPFFLFAEQKQWKHSHQPAFLWALKLYAFCNKNIKKHGGEFINFEAHSQAAASPLPVLKNSNDIMCCWSYTQHAFYLSHISSALVLKASPTPLAHLSHLEQSFDAPLIATHDFKNQLNCNSCSINAT